MTGLWKCRLVCKSWNKAIEDLHELHNRAPFVKSDRVYNPIASQDHLARYAHCELNICTYKLIKEFDQAHAHYDNVKNKNHPSQKITRNPFLGRNVAMYMVLNTERGRSSTRELMEKWGREIWYLTISDFGPDCDSVEFYLSLRNILFKIPNLRVLNIRCPTERGVLGNTTLSQLEKEIIQNSLPTLSKLLSISFENLPRPIYNHIRLLNRIPDDCAQYVVC